ncbi:MAG TPA: DUF3800 domain-containing protein [Pyrinomonadaceae bacterium]|nr:DUF3800 domain-containing protein [Pyrinomonadaceae bacterium]
MRGTVTNNYEAFENLCRIIIPEYNKDQVIGMFNGYFDESGTHASSAVVCVAGCLSTAEQWSLFQREWQEVLDEAGIEVFHMSEFESRVRAYKDWSNEKRRYVQSKLLNIIISRISVGIAAAVVRSDYDKIIIGPHRENHDGPYTFCASMCFAFAGGWAEENGYDEPISYIFEDGALGKQEVDTQFSNAYKNEKARQFYRLGSLVFDDKRRFNQLQAADILAYEMYKHVLRVTGKEKRPTRTSMLILDVIPMKRRFFDEKALLDFIAPVE